MTHHRLLLLKAAQKHARNSEIKKFKNNTSIDFRMKLSDVS